MGSDDEKDKGFKVTDRRLIDKDEPAPETPPEPEPERESVAGGEGGPAGDQLPPLDFSGLIMSLATSALIQMGEAPNPHTGESEADIEGARQTIDIIGILKEKTRGNLDEREEKLIDNILAELRFRFVNKRGS